MWCNANQYDVARAIHDQQRVQFDWRVDRRQLEPNARILTPPPASAALGGFVAALTDFLCATATAGTLGVIEAAAPERQVL